MFIRLLFIFLICVSQLVWANVPIMPIKDLQPGMQGVGKTVIQGDTIEEFNVEILGVSGTETSGYSIFVRLYGPLIEKTGGVAQGMSGSPVYVDGRLVGAVAFGKTFNDPHYCFLTPIGNMLQLIDEPAVKPHNWLPKGTSLMAGGFTPLGLEYLQEKLTPLGLDAMGAGSAGSAGGVGSSKALEPGSAVGAAIMQGDLTLGALGTVTWTDAQGKILAFGHPFMQRGNSNFFMNKAWVLGCIPNMQSSYKVGNIGEAIGTFTQDRASGIGGAVGKLPETIPVHVTCSDLTRGLNNSTRVQIIDDEQLVPAIVDAAVINSISKTVDRNGGGTAKMHFTVTGVDSNGKQLKLDRENMYYSNQGLLKNVNLELVEAVNTLMQNKLDKVNIYGISVEAEVSEEVQVAEITNAVVKERKVKAGAKVPVSVIMKPYRGKEFTETVYFAVPKDHPGGQLVLNVRGGSSMAWIINTLRKQKEEGLPAAQKQEQRRSLADYVKSVNDADKNNELIIDIAALPMKPAEMANDAGLAGLLQGSPFKQKYPYDFIIDGECEIALQVEK